MLSNNNTSDICLHGPQEACLPELEQLVLSDLKRYMRRAKRYVESHQDAEDAVQDALLSAYEHLASFRNQSKLSTWLTTIVINAARSKRRQRRPSVSYEHLLETVESPILVAKLTQDKRPGPEEIYARDEMSLLLARLVDELSPIYRAAIYLFYVNELNTADASSLLGVPISTFKAHLLRARKQLRSRIKDSVGLRLRIAPFDAK